MKTRGLLLPLLILVAMMFGYVADVRMTAKYLPEGWTTQFRTRGGSIKTVSKEGFVHRMLTVMGFPLFCIGGVFVTRLMSKKGYGLERLNARQREKWIEHEHFVRRQVTWFACLLVDIFAIINHLIVRDDICGSPAAVGLPIFLLLGAATIWALFRKA
ncbi:MAG: hypothetical protein K8R23_00955 [Chthoniobacter sp.]|nr:hypothetical protein [Chthoniobacter sp.]